MQRNDPLQFRRVCGDSFVASFRTGATLRGTITFSTRSEQEAQQIRSEAGAQAAGSSASAAALLATVASRNSSDLSVRGEVVGLGPVPFSLDGEELINNAAQIAVMAAARPDQLARVSFETTDYGIFRTSPATVDEAIRQDALAKLGTDFALVARTLADLTYLRDSADEFGPFRIETLSARVTAMNVEQGALFEFARPCIERREIANCRNVLARPPVSTRQFRRVVEVRPNVNQLGLQFVATLRAGEFARVTGTGGWFVSVRRDQEHFRPIGAGVANQLIISTFSAPTDLSAPRNAGPGGDIHFQVIDCCPGDNEATPNFLIRCAFYPFAEDVGNV